MSQVVESAVRAETISVAPGTAAGSNGGRGGTGDGEGTAGGKPTGDGGGDCGAGRGSSDAFPGAAALAALAGSLFGAAFGGALLTVAAAGARAEGALLRRSNFERRTWTPAVERVGLDPGLTFHGLRHTAGSILIAEGASIVELSAVRGWSNSTAVAMSMRYGHLFAARDEHLTQALERVYRTARRPNDGQVTPKSPMDSGETGF